MNLLFESLPNTVPEFIKKNIEEIICPLSYQIFLDPVMLETGITYEKDFIMEWLQKNNTCPKTLQKLKTKEIIIPHIIKNLVKKFLIAYPELKPLQYVKKTIYSYIDLKNISEIYNYSIINHSRIIVNETHNLIKFLLQGSVEHIKYYIDKSDDLETKNKNGSKLIHLVCENCSKKIIEYLLEKGVDLEAETINKWKPIHFVCKFQNNFIIKLFMEEGVDLEAETEEKWKPIHIACIYQNYEIVKLLAEKGVDLEVKTTRNSKPLHLACYNKNSEIVKILLEKGVDINLACYNKNSEIVKILLEKGVDINLENNDGDIPIHFICKYFKLEIIQYMLDNYKFNILRKNFRGETPIDLLKKKFTFDINITNIKPK
jgi:ankyrin repeat protein